MSKLCVSRFVPHFGSGFFLLFYYLLFCPSVFHRHISQWREIVGIRMWRCSLMFCRVKYETFTSKCLEHVSQACLEDKDCQQFLDSDDLICSNSTECRAAYVSLWGSVLQAECTCDTPPGAEHAVCTWFHRTLHSRSCLSKLKSLMDCLVWTAGRNKPATGLPYRRDQYLRIHLSILKNLKRKMLEVYISEWSY